MIRICLASGGSSDRFYLRCGVAVEPSRNLRGLNTGIYLYISLFGDIQLWVGVPLASFALAAPLPEPTLSLKLRTRNPKPGNLTLETRNPKTETRIRHRVFTHPETVEQGLERDWVTLPGQLHTVDYDPFIKSQLASRNYLQGLVCFQFGHVTPRNSTLELFLLRSEAALKRNARAGAEARPGDAESQLRWVS